MVYFHSKVKGQVCLARISRPGTRFALEVNMKNLSKIFVFVAITLLTVVSHGQFFGRPDWVDRPPSGNYSFYDITGRTYYLTIETSERSIQFHACMVHSDDPESPRTASSGWQDIPRPTIVHRANKGVWIQATAGVFPGSGDGTRHMGITWDDNGDPSIGFSNDNYLILGSGSQSWYELEPAQSNPCEGFAETNSGGTRGRPQASEL